jgi:hypothetical protein
MHLQEKEKRLWPEDRERKLPHGRMTNPPCHNASWYKAFVGGQGKEM